MQWFDHSSTAASDDAVMALRMEHPDSAAVDLYWAIVEKQYRDEGSVPFEKTNRETKSVLYRLLLGFDEAQKYVETMLEIGLLKKDEHGNVYSERAKKTIDEYLLKAETARQNGKKGGRKPKQKPTQKPSDKPSDKPTQKPYNNTKQDNTEIGLDKTKPISSSAPDGADADEPAPPAAPGCPLCSGPLEKTGMPDPDFWWCGACREGFPEGKAAR